MGCGSCSTGSCSSTTAGCGQTGGCATGGCNKLNTYDWFNAAQQPTLAERENIYEVRFKNTRKAFFVNVNGLSLMTGDFVVVESDRGYDLGQVSLGGILARLQMRKKKIKPDSDKVKKIYRKAVDEDMEKLKIARSREQETLERTRVIINDLSLDMKLSDVEFQGDNTKAIFYYIADQRVDFRELIKILANDFRIRVEMKQIGLRHESGLVGGIGSCGRELCCSTWLTDFKNVSTSAARYQNLSLNPMKISGQCGRLKCCLNFELEAYLDALDYIPRIDKLDTEIGIAFLQKTDIFKRVMWFSYVNESSWIPLSVDHVIQLKEMNNKGIKPASLQGMDESGASGVKIDFVDVVGQATLREDKNRKRKSGKKKKQKSGQGQQNQNQDQSKNPPRNQNQQRKKGGRNNNRSNNGNKGENQGNNNENSK